MDIVAKLMKLQDRFFADFQAKLLPTIDRSSIIGVRIPILRDIAKQWNPTVKYLENKRLSPWVLNKTIPKALESFRITAEQKIYLKGLKLKES